MGLCWTVFTRNRGTAVPTEGNGDLQTLICVLVARPRQCESCPFDKTNGSLSGYTLRMKLLFCGWPVMVHDTRTGTRIRRILWSSELCYVAYLQAASGSELTMSSGSTQESTVPDVPSTGVSKVDYCNSAVIVQYDSCATLTDLRLCRECRADNKSVCRFHAFRR